ncbi:Nuclear transcription factor Y subunit C-8 [Arabidopsis thaliana]|uniref:NF-YC8 n=2 Tax=Arabidopsis TaxID=3701 RepID=A0A178UI33_ARATH|nr:Histone-fold [Arabidopsis thaliana x Arabidopsis arenosa]OAO93616.1 NF-YC8 [Arabidopsis thaliana]
MENNNGNHQLPPKGNEQLKSFWSKEMEGNLDFKNHELPITRIKKIMKYDPDVTMIASEAPILLSKACEMFIMDLTMRSWLHAQESKRVTLQKSNVDAAVAQTVIFDFLLDDDIEVKRESVAAAADPVAMPPIDDGEMPPGMVIGTPVYCSLGIHQPQPQMQAWPGAWTSVSGEEEEAHGKKGGDDGN